MIIERKLMAHFVDTAEQSTSGTHAAVYERLGKDLEEYNVELSASVNTTKNILGESTTKIDSYEVTSSVEPYYADKDTLLFPRLQKIVDERQVLDKLKTTVVEVHLWKEATSGAYPAYREDAVFEVTSYGGDTTGYQIPFNLHYVGNRVKGTFDLSTKTFTPEENNAES